MKYLILTLLIVASPSQAFDWPWQDKPHEDYSYCKGFAYSGLASTAVTSVSRIQLWLDWNNVVRTQFEKGTLDGARFELGKARFVVAPNIHDRDLDVVTDHDGLIALSR